MIVQVGYLPSLGSYLGLECVHNFFAALLGLECVHNFFAALLVVSL